MPPESLMMGLRGSENSRMGECVCVCVFGGDVFDPWHQQQQALEYCLSASPVHWNHRINRFFCLSGSRTQLLAAGLAVSNRDALAAYLSIIVSSSLSHWASSKRYLLLFAVRLSLSGGLTSLNQSSLLSVSVPRTLHKGARTLYITGARRVGWEGWSL